MASPSEHADNIKAAILAARADGLSLYVDWYESDGLAMLNLYHYSTGQVDIGDDLILVEEYR